MFDQLITATVAGIGVAITAIGSAVPPSRSSRAKTVSRVAFIVLGMSLVGLSYVESARTSAAARARDLDRQRNEGSLKYMQGQLDSANKLLASVAANSSPAQLASALRKTLPSVPRVRAMEVKPVTIRDLSGKELSKRVKDFSNRLRQLANDGEKQSHETMMQRMDEDAALPTQEDRHKNWIRYAKLEQDQQTQVRYLYNRDFRALAIIYRDELVRRLDLPPSTPAPDGRWNVAFSTIDEGWTAPMGLMEAATYLEYLADQVSGGWPR